MKNPFKFRIMPQMSIISHLGLKELIFIFAPAAFLIFASICLFLDSIIIPGSLGILSAIFLSLAPIWSLIQKIKLKRFFKKGDFILLKQVLAFLKKYGLTADLKGKARINFLKGKNREYRDIDLAVNTANIPFSKKYQKYIEAIQELTRISGGKEYLDWKVKDETEGFAMYVGLNIEFRFRITNPKSETSIDISFGESHEKDLRGKGNNLPISCAPLMYFGEKKGEKDKES